MSNHVYGAFYGNSPKRKPRGTGAKRSSNGNLAVGNGNLTPRKRMSANGKPMGGGMEKRPHWLGNLLNNLLNGSCHCTRGDETFNCRKGRHPDCASACTACTGAMNPSGGSVSGLRKRR